MSGKGIILTRPAGYNDSLVEKLATAGYRILERPLLSIEPMALDDAAKQRVIDLDRYDVAVFVSRNAVTHGMQHLQHYWPQWPARLKWCAMGQRTAYDLKAFDIQATFPEKQGAIGLIETMDWSTVSKVLVVRGKGGLETFYDELSERAIQVDYLEVYQRTAKLHKSLAQEIVDLQFEVVILTSGEALASLVESLDGQLLGKLKAIVPTERIAELARQSGLNDLLVSESVSDDAVLTILASI